MAEMAEMSGIILHFEKMPQWEMLSDEQAGILVKALLRYGKEGEVLQTNDGMIAMAFSFMAAQIDLSFEKYQRVCDRNAQNGAKGGRPKKQTVSEETQKTQSVSEKPKKANNNNNNNNNNNSHSNWNGYHCYKVYLIILRPLLFFHHQINGD